MTDKSRRDYILGVVEDLVGDLLYYSRKGDEDLPVGQIEEAVRAGEVTLGEITVKFAETLRQHLPEPEDAIVP